MSRLGEIGGKLFRGEISFDFVGRQKIWYTISGAILVVAVASLAIFHLNMGVEFKGGSVFNFTAPHATQSQIRNDVQSASGLNDVIVQQTTGGQWRVQTESLTSAKVNEVQTKLADNLGLKSADSVSPQIIGPSWGGEISKKAVEGLIIFLILVILYLSIAFEWKMAVSALIALAHDIVITVGIYALVQIEVTPASVIGLLTILGYSLYDTVVVFDKVRENTAGLLAERKQTYSGAANLAVNQTLVRSINTSVMALLPVIAILAVAITVLGGGTLEDLALVLFIGMISGTYSSIFVATPLLADMKEREPQYKELARRIAARAAGPRGRRKAAVAAAGEAGEFDADDEPADSGEDGDGTSEPRVTATSGSAAGRRPMRQQGPRQQPRRGSRRRPGGGKRHR